MYCPGNPQPDRLHHRVWLAVSLVAVAICGCSSIRCKSVWIDGGRNPLAFLHQAHTLLHNHHAPAIDSETFDPLQLARQRYDQAEMLADWNSPDSLEEFYAAGLWSWYAGAANEEGAPRTIYNQSVSRLIYEGQLHHRLNPRQGFEVEHAGKRQTVPMEFHGFDWTSDDFHELHVVGHYGNRSLAHYQTTEGVGVPVVVLRNKPKGAKHESDFLPPVANFAATAVLKPDGSALALYNPVRYRSVEVDGKSVTIARDLTANIAYGLHHHPQRRIQDFLRPYRSDDPAVLYFTEPFQSNKIPVILVHGLLSSPDAWANVYNDLRTSPEIAETYQFWAFGYPTGAPFIRSASALRTQMDKVRARFDPDGTNCQLKRSVLIGHSMGGLISKLMIAHSGEAVWNAVANLPLETVATDEATRAMLAERFYFDPHPMASRVVFIAAPHRGSGTAGRACGRLASALVAQDNAQFEQILRDNEGGFKETITRGLPTSIDMLDPQQPFLDTLNALHLNESVPMHSIIGNKFQIPGHTPSDGIVSIDSAQQSGVESSLLIPATHNGLLRNDDTVAELKRILHLHAAE